MTNTLNSAGTAAILEYERAARLAADAGGPYISCLLGHEPDYDHGDLCQICGRYCLHPTDEDSRNRHRAEHDLDLQISLGVARSKDKTCGVCLDVIFGNKRFGILPNCNHTFCFHCIRLWRRSKQFNVQVKRGCPECRVMSNFVCPSYFWVETKEEKKMLIDGYMRMLQTKDCQYFLMGQGTCLFGNKCFYKHTLPSGEAIDVGPPKQTRRHVGSAQQNERFNSMPVFDIRNTFALIESILPFEVFRRISFSRQRS